MSGTNCVLEGTASGKSATSPQGKAHLSNEWRKVGHDKAFVAVLVEEAHKTMQDPL